MGHPWEVLPLTILLLAVLTVVPLAHAGSGTTEPHAVPAAEPALAPVAAGGTEASRPVLPAAQVGQLRIIVGTRNATVVPNTGLQCNITGWAAVPVPANTSFQVGAEETIGSYTAVFGLFENNPLSVRPFFSVFQANTDALVRLTYWNGYPVLGGSAYEFDLVHIANTTWTLSVNGFVFDRNESAGSFNFGASEATDASGVGFSEVAFVQSQSPVPARLPIPVAFAVLQSGQWEVPNTGYLLSIPASPPPWGVVGRAQSSALAPDELLTGSSVAPTANNSTLWSGGAVPVQVTVAPSTPTVVGTTELEVAVRVTEAGAPVANVTLGLSDSLGSMFEPASVETLPSGNASAVMVAANVSQPSTDSVLARVTLLGYVGFSTGSLVVTPPAQVLLQVSPSSIGLGSARTVAIIVRATFTNGSVAANVPLAISVSGPGTVEPQQGMTGANGELNLTLSVNGMPGDLVLTVTVAGGGLWGSLVADLGNRSSFNFLAAYGVYFVVAALASILAVVAWLVVRRRRRRRELPPMGFSANQETPMPAPRSDDAASRTPPEEGNP